MARAEQSGYTYRAQDSTQLHPTEKKIRSFHRYQKGWHYGEGTTFSRHTIRHALELHREAVRGALFATDAFPGLNGQIVFTIYQDDHYLEFTVEASGEVTFCQEKNQVEVSYREGLSLDEAKRLIQEFGRETWKQSVSSARSSTTPAWAGFRAAPFRTRAVEGSPSSAGTVYAHQA